MPDGGFPGVWGNSAGGSRTQAWQSVVSVPKQGITGKANSYLVLLLLMGVAVRAAKATGSDVARFVPIDVFEDRQILGWIGTVSALGQTAGYMKGGPLVDIEPGNRGANNPTSTRCRFGSGVDDVEFDPPIRIELQADPRELLAVVLDWLMANASWVLAEVKGTSKQKKTPRAEGSGTARKAESSPSRDEANTRSQTLSNGATLSTLHRRLLEPLILPRIQRHLVLEKIWPRITKSVDQAVPVVIAIVGPAGYGKSVILGEIYDKIRISFESFNAVLVLCSNIFDDDVDVSVLERAVGASLGQGDWRVRGRGHDLANDGWPRFILFDTVDLILTPRGAASFRDFVASASSEGISVILTCRDWEYEEQLERATRFHALENVDRYRVPPFVDDEIREAALGYLAREDAHLSQDQRTVYVTRLLQISADTRSLDGIIRSPLLLGLLCKLFPPPSLPPADLTTARLFDIYWDAVVRVGRRDGAYTSASAARERVCLAIAEQMYATSRNSGRVIERVSHQFVAQAMHGDATAIREIRSAGVVVPTEDDRGLRFFHQTLQEYAIALWLTQSPDTLRDFMQLFAEQDRYDISPWAPVLRLVLVLSECADRMILAKRLDLRHFTLFRAVAFAAGATGDAPLTQQLLDIARKQDGEYERTLVTAIDAGLGLAHPSTVGIVCGLIREGDPSAATEAVVGVVSACTREIHAGESTVFCGVLNAACARSPFVASQLCGRFLTLLEIPAERALPDDCLAALRNHWVKFGDRAQAVAIRAHLQVGVGANARRVLWDAIRDKEPPAEIGREIAALWAMIDEETLPQGEAAVAQYLVDRLQEKRSRGWMVANARVVGRLASHRSESIARLVKEFIQGSTSLIEGLLIALSELCRIGNSSEIVSELLAYSPGEIDSRRVSAVMSLADSIGHAWWCERPFPVVHGGKLVHWASTWQTAAISALSCQLCFVESAQSHLAQILQALPPNEESRQIRRILEILRQCRDTARIVLPPDFLKLLGTFRDPSGTDIDSILVAAELSSLQGGAIGDVLTMLIPAAAGNQRDAALQASKRISEFASLDPAFDPCILIPVVRSPFQGVAANAADAMTVAVKHDRPHEGILEVLAERLCTERHSRLVVALLDAAEAVAQYSGTETADLLRAADDQIRYLGALSHPDGGIVLGLVRLLSKLSRDNRLLPAVTATTVQLLRSLDIGRVGDGERISVPLITNCGRVNGVLDATVRDEPGIIEGNATAVAIAIRRVQGSSSPLLDDLLRRFPSATRLRGMIDGWRAR